MKIGIVIQRFGPDIIGGAEVLCRSVALRLAASADVEVFTTCAKEYLHWRNHYEAGTVTDGLLTVHRFPVAEERDPVAFGDRSNRLFAQGGSRAEEEAWFRANGPYCPELVEAVTAARHLDVVLLYCFRYWPSFEVIRKLGRRCVLCPTAEDDPVLELALTREVLNAPGGILYLTPEERDLVHRQAANEGVRHLVAGAAVETPAPLEAAHFVAEHGLPETFCLYVGRFDVNKGCRELFAYYPEFCSFMSSSVPLVLAGHAVLPPPRHEHIRDVGPLAEKSKFDALAAASVLVLPSKLESLSMVLLEAWSTETPVLVNAACAVTRGQCIRSGGGLYYTGFREFAECLDRLLADRPLRRRLGEAGQRYVDRHYRWPVVAPRILAFLSVVAREQS
ncbi:MAG: glycosyltransferase family 4 protein [Candidatus Schekmanbacteria bacterium]|nr:glycosyltransferase family 4 protein [Candidatus Schekmanbacteria bacterium]